MGRFFLIILFLILLTNMCWALEKKVYSIRDNLINLTFDALQKKEKEREKAFKDAFMEASIKSEEEEKTYTEIKEGEFLKKVLEYLRYSVSHSLEYNDNIYGFEDKTSDIINRIRPEVKLKLSDIRAEIDFTLGLLAAFYTQHPQHNNQVINFDFGLKRRWRYYDLNIQNEIIKSYVAPMELGLSEGIFPSYWMEDFKVILGRRFNRLALGVGYGLRYSDYESKYSYERDVISNEWKIILEYRIAPKTSFASHLIYALNNHLYDSSRDSDFKELGFGLRGLLTHKLTGILGLGYRYQNYKNVPDFKSVTSFWDLNYNFSKFINFSFGFRRTTEESGYANENYYIENSFSWGILQKLAFNPRIFIRLNSDFSYRDYPKMRGLKREDDIWSLGIGLGYQTVKWFEFALGYKYQRRSSNIEYDYNNNIFTFTTTATF